MSIYIKEAFELTWMSLLIFWIVSARKNKKMESQEPLFKRFIFYWLPLIIAVLLLGPGKWFGHSLLRENFVPHSNLVGSIGLFFSIGGALLAMRSRQLLGKNWSLSVQKKEGHELIMVGPYKWVRHPIYLGLLMLFLGKVLIEGDLRGILALLIVFFSFLYKLKKEERLMRETFGPLYYEYEENSKALIPFIF